MDYKYSTLQDQTSTKKEAARVSEAAPRFSNKRGKAPAERVIAPASELAGSVVQYSTGNVVVFPYEPGVVKRQRTSEVLLSTRELRSTLHSTVLRLSSLLLH